MSLKGFINRIRDRRQRGQSQDLSTHINYPKPPASGRQVQPDEIRDLVEDIRKRYELDVAIWRLRHVGPHDRKLVETKMRSSDAILQKIKGKIYSWDSKDAFESERDYEKLQEIKRRIEEGGKREWAGNPPWKDLET